MSKSGSPEERVLWTAFLGGVLGVVAVLLGNYFHVRGFNPDTGYWGVNFLNSYLYGMPNAISLGIVCGVWFVYGALAAGLIEATILSRRAKPA
jgi:hypothetical protein